MPLRPPYGVLEHFLVRGGILGTRKALGASYIRGPTNSW